MPYMEFHTFGRIDDFVDESLSIENGFSSPSDKPGHGIKFDFDKLKKFMIN